MDKSRLSGQISVGVAVLIFLVVVWMTQACITTENRLGLLPDVPKLPEGVSAQLHPKGIPFKGVINVPPDWPDISVYEMSFQAYAVFDELQDLGFVYYFDGETNIKYVFTVLTDKSEVIAGEVIHLDGFFHLYWIYENNMPHPKDCNEGELMDHLGAIIDESKPKGTSI